MAIKINKQTKKTIEKQNCVKCTNEKPLTNFYQSNSTNFSNGRYVVCKDCIKESLEFNDGTDYNSEEVILKLQTILIEMNRPFILKSWQRAIDEYKSTGKDIFGIYFRYLATQHRMKTWQDSDQFSQEELVDTVEQVEVVNNSDGSINLEELEDKNRDDVLRMLAYDPFEFEAKEDKRHLYNKLVDFLDEGTLEDNFKLPTVIEIVKGFNQIDKLNNAISAIVSDPKKLVSNTGAINSLIASKEKILKTCLALAKDNGISVNHNNTKSKGAGTLTGIIKSLQEKGFEEASVNLFDIETCEGMLQVANISNESIMKQLNFDENDYTNMILDQRQMIQELESKTLRLEEENRLLKIEMLKYRNGGNVS